MYYRNRSARYRVPGGGVKSPFQGGGCSLVFRGGGRISTRGGRGGLAIFGGKKRPFFSYNWPIFLFFAIFIIKIFLKTDKMVFGIFFQILAVFLLFGIFCLGKFFVRGDRGGHTCARVCNLGGGSRDFLGGGANFRGLGGG